MKKAAVVMSNRFQMVPREFVHGVIEGVDFGYAISVLARSPSAVLIWSSGTAYTSGRETRYGESSLYGLPDRTAAFSRHPIYKHFGPDGGRLSIARIDVSSAEIAGLFGDAETPALVREAVRQRTTLLIEGGGPRLMPSRKLGTAAYDLWRAEPNRGFATNTRGKA